LGVVLTTPHRKKFLVATPHINVMREGSSRTVEPWRRRRRRRRRIYSKTNKTVKKHAT
jgi:hypothetical protein